MTPAWPFRVSNDRVLPLLEAKVMHLLRGKVVEYQVRVCTGRQRGKPRSIQTA